MVPSNDADYNPHTGNKMKRRNLVIVYFDKTNQIPVIKGEANTNLSIDKYLGRELGWGCDKKKTVKTKSVYV